LSGQVRSFKPTGRNGWYLVWSYWLMCFYLRCVAAWWAASLRFVLRSVREKPGNEIAKMVRILSFME
ncbi:MAG TPA: hypothetical protein VNR18_00220, partial [Hyphomicrobiales bacterium]|nr:hypothetical protein [Hyphomicrobiales bacterium]